MRVLTAIALAAPFAFALAVDTAPFSDTTTPDMAPSPSREEFAQGVDYRIEAVLHEDRHVLVGRARLRYKNNSPHGIDTLWVHQHLNAFRPNSAWARRELLFDERRFQDQEPGGFAYERFSRISAAGEEIRAVYPVAPDSTVAGLPLPQPLAPSAEVVVEMDWEARLSTTPRRQGRRGRHYDFAQWYPRIAVYDSAGWHPHPLLPQGEFFGEFASYDVTLDLAADQVVAATGVPVEGDPGWRTAAGEPPDESMLRRDFYATASSPRPGPEQLGLLSERTPVGRKRVRWRAENVHHFAWSADPEFIYDGGWHAGLGPGETALHVLYLPGDEGWGGGRAVDQAARTLRFLEGVFGPYVYPQLTLLHRLDSGGTEFPMLVMNSGAGEGLITHEVTHQYAHAILANNEWKDAWLDEGLTSFLSSWFREEQGQDAGWRRTMEFAASWPRRAHAQPVATPAAEFAVFQLYALMSYTKASIIFRMLREYLGENSFRDGLRLYYERNKLTHVDEYDFRRAMEDASGQELDWFFRQWLHSDATLDYRLGEVESQMREDRRWVTRVEVIRDGDAWMPVVLRVGDRLELLDSRAAAQVVEVETAERPVAVELDPERVLLDTDWENNGSELR